MDKCQLQAPDYPVEAEHYKALFTEAKEKNEYLCKELERIKSEEFQEAAARAIYNGILKAKEQIEKNK